MALEVDKRKQFQSFRSADNKQDKLCVLPIEETKNPEAKIEQEDLQNMLGYENCSPEILEYLRKYGILQGIVLSKRSYEDETVKPPGSIETFDVQKLHREPSVVKSISLPEITIDCQAEGI